MAERLAALEPHRRPARKLGRIAGGKALVRPYGDFEQQASHIRLRNPFGVELRWLEIAINEGDRQQVREAMVGVFLRVDVRFRTEAPTAGEVIGALDRIRFDAGNLGGIKWMQFAQLKGAEDRRRCCSFLARAGRSNPIWPAPTPALPKPVSMSPLSGRSITQRIAIT